MIKSKSLSHHGSTSSILVCLILLCWISNTLLLINSFEIHDLLSKIIELPSSQWFCHIISNHPVFWAVFHFHFLAFDKVIHEKEFYIKMS
jgi:hypothetical protein